MSPLWGHWQLCSELWVISPLGFKVRVGSLISHLAEAYMLHIRWDSPLVQHLLTSWQPVWQPSPSLPYTCEQALVGLETRIYHAASAPQCETRQTFYRLSYAGSAINLTNLIEDMSWLEICFHLDRPCPNNHPSQNRGEECQGILLHKTVSI